MRILLFFFFCALLSSSCSHPIKQNPGNPEFSSSSHSGSDVSATYLKTILRFEEYADRVWNNHERIPNTGYWGDGINSGNGGIRGSMGVALGMVILAMEFPEDKLSKQRLERINAALLYAALTHRSSTHTTVNGAQWGHSWQSSLWAGTMALSAALIEEQLDQVTLKAVKSVLVDEANFRSEQQPSDGYRKNTAAEENAWNAPILALAAAWLPQHPNSQKWLTGAKKFLANVYTNGNVQNEPLGDWVTTQTLYPSFALENHGFYHPIYHAVSTQSMGEAFLICKLLKPSLAAEIQPFAEHNVPQVWRFMQSFIRPNGDLSFPSGLDWALNSFEHNSYYPFIGINFSDPVAQTLESNLVRLIEERQLVNGDGRYVGESVPNGFYREAVAVRRISFSYLHHKAAGFPKWTISKNLDHGVVHHKDVKLIAHRSSKSLVTLSYGAKVMLLVYPTANSQPQERYLTSPLSGALLSKKSKGNTSAKLVSFEETAQGFNAILEVDNNQGMSTFYIESTGDSLAVVEVPSIERYAKGPTFPYAIINDSLSGGERTIASDQLNVIVPERSDYDQRFTHNWINIDESLLYQVGSKENGTIRYDVPNKYNRLGAAEDRLSYQANNPAEPRFLILYPHVSFDKSQSLINETDWTVEKTGGSLKYLTPAHKIINLDFVLSPETRKQWN